MVSKLLWIERDEIATGVGACDHRRALLTFTYMSLVQPSGANRKPVFNGWLNNLLAMRMPMVMCSVFIGAALQRRPRSCGLMYRYDRLN